MNKNKKMIAAVVIMALIAIAAFAYSNGKSQNESVSGTATTSPVSSSPILTQDYNGKTLQLNKGDRFLLKLGEEQWNLSFQPDNIVSRVKNIMVVRGAQGIYTADAAGTTVLTAEGRPNCTAGQMCAQYIISFKATIVVK